jgi:hypothetical protein
MYATISGLLQPLFAAHAEALSAELQAFFVARLEELFKPLRDLVDQVSRIWDLIEALGGSLVLTNSSESVEHEDLEAFGVAASQETDADVVAGCSSKMEMGAQTLDVLPCLDDALPEMVI